MNTNTIALAISVFLVGGLVISLGAASFLSGVIARIFDRPKFSFFKSKYGEKGLAFSFKLGSTFSSEKFDTIVLKLFNPFGKIKMLELTRPFPVEKKDFTQDIDLGDDLKRLLEEGEKGRSSIQIEVSSSKTGTSYHYLLKKEKFLKLRQKAVLLPSDLKTEEVVKSDDGPKVQFGIMPRNMVVDTVPGRGPKLKLAINPEFSQEFQNQGTGEGSAGVAAVENFSVTKVWIEPGCIVCNACEDIYPEVFDVLADTCIIKEGAPLNDGLKIEEAADACPVEVIKFTK